MKEKTHDSISGNPFFAGPPRAPQAAPSQFQHDQLVRSWTVKASLQKAWAWLKDPATFTDGQVFPYRVEFASAEKGVPRGFEVGGLNMHHGPGLLASGTMVEIRPLEYRDLQYFYGSYVLSLRLVRPTRLQFWLEETPQGTRVTVQLDALVKNWFRPVWRLGNRFFWMFFGFWLRRAIS